jgi:hypothetical protein
VTTAVLACKVMGVLGSDDGYSLQRRGDPVSPMRARPSAQRTLQSGHDGGGRLGDRRGLH